MPKVLEEDGMDTRRSLSAILAEVLFALLFLLRLKIGGISGVAPLSVTMMALNLVVIFGLLYHHNLVDATLSSRSDGSDIQGYILTLTLTRGSNVEGFNGVLIMLVVIMMILDIRFIPELTGGASASLNRKRSRGSSVSAHEGEDLAQVLAFSQDLQVLGFFDQLVQIQVLTTTTGSHIGLSTARSKRSISSIGLNGQDQAHCNYYL
ncbi:hypothetical protein TCAL_16672 [Tigriopus californicus]|uniref:Uncharacterized protein n=1 Tax=Tigriopus californicus TaxID=6832 RepID=A0A553PJC9_TIGCA|nr:hypothetical protein TCAL_16672 [Tigriopus californicus]